MDRLIFRYEQTALIDTATILQESKPLISVFNEIKKNLDKKYATDYASVYLPHDTSLLKTVQDLIDKKQKLHPSLIVVIGIGGSNLGTIAVQEAVLGKMYSLRSDLDLPFVVSGGRSPKSNPYERHSHPFDSGPQGLRSGRTADSAIILYADTVDSDYIADLLRITEQYLQQKKSVLVNVISKSGTTTETIANFELFLELLQQYHPKDFHNYVVATTDKDSKLWQLAGQENFDRLEIPELVGGRYSVLSAVGLFPLGMLGIDIAQLQAGAHQIQQQCLSSDIQQNPAAVSAILKYYYYKQSTSIADMFLFSVECEGLGKWYRQLMGESIGKQFDLDGKQVRVGITPTVSVGSTDLHSVGQLYLGGPLERFTTFVTIKKNRHNLKIPNDQPFASIVENIQGRSLSSIMKAIIDGTQLAYQKTHLPFCSVTLPEKNAFSIGQFLQLYMLEIIYLGKLLHINPFDQPQVELYKNETRKILAHE